ncbi:hypothetical protein W97_08992 [Coniosporium apollinis CBS 100218]|uniref:GDP/GTP exchange factor Sec2 N-terminal domain-containing protein n=1 Tax=Coniosporium apollinis (strain CBS 100218) TaxID=1168221 RepID=R7Z6B8_CONA1|nr:uncharacterized protein W97_08992 [Coniosporium apollinis CBS 100218]EON69730.1 hypothetical protein W97_08992 [Coniosporium apollinis CBS 100218]
MSAAVAAAVLATELQCTCVETFACPVCGIAFPRRQDQEAQQRVAELEAQIGILTGKATAAADKIADYEDRFLQQVKSSRDNLPSAGQPSEDTDRPSLEAGNARPCVTRTTSKSRFSFLSRKAASAVTVPTLGNPDPDVFPTRNSDPHALMVALANERHLREQAEAKVTQMSVEIEDLSVNLFQQANEMVAEERKARAKLEERIEVLEERDRERTKRLDRLEEALTRIGRVRGLLGS